MTCSLCPAYKRNGNLKPWFPPPKKSAKIAIILPYREYIDVDVKRLKKWLNELSIPEEHVYVTTVLRCMKPKSKDDLLKHMKVCYTEHMAEELGELDLRTIVLMGGQTHNTMVESGKKIGEIVNRSIKRGEYTIYTTYSLQHLDHLENPILTKSAKTHIKLAYNIAMGNSIEVGQVKTHMIKTYDQLLDLYHNLMHKKEWAFDWETMGLDNESELIGISFAWNSYEGYYLPLRIYELLFGWTEYTIYTKDKIKINLYNFLKDVLVNSKAKKIAQGGKFEIRMAKAQLGIDVKVDHDTQFIHYLLNPHIMSHSLETISKQYGDMTDYKDVGAEFRKHGWEKIPLARIAEYGAKDSILTYRYKQDAYSLMPKKMKNVAYNQILIPGSHLIAEMEYEGLYINRPYLGELEKKLTPHIDEIKKEINEYAGYDINISSTPQMQKFLYTDLEISTKGVKKIKTGYSTDKYTIEFLAEEYKNPTLLKIKEYRQAVKMRSTYVDHLKEHTKSNGYYYPTWKLTRAITGRLASGSEDKGKDSLNMHNTPVRDDPWGIKKLFGAPNGFLYGGADYSQIELRILAEITQDPELLKAFAMDYDPHSFVASSYSGYTYEEIMLKKGIDKFFKALRDGAKTIGFGWIYGAHTGKFAEGDTALFKSVVEEKKAKRAYFERFAYILPWKEETLELARQNGYVETLTGRRRYFPDLTLAKVKGNFSKINAAEREAINTIIQGTASDYLFRSAYDLNEEFKTYGENIFARVINLIHDAVYFYCLREKLDETIEIVKQVLLTKQFDIEVKMGLDIEVKENTWGDDETVYAWEGSIAA